MKTKNKISKAKAWTRGVLPLCLTACLTLFTSCADFFEQDSNMVVFADKDHLNDATDSIYSVIGILNKLQAVADRTVLLGEARADLVDVTAAANADLRDVAMSNIGDDNKYNRPARLLCRHHQLQLFHQERRGLVEEQPQRIYIPARGGGR